jgi:hypothetical protein
MSTVRRSSRHEKKTPALNPSAKPIPAARAKGRRAVRPTAGTEEARERFARTFADVLSGRFGGRWTIEWKGADLSPAAPAGRAALPDGE